MSFISKFVISIFIIVMILVTCTIVFNGPNFKCKPGETMGWFHTNRETRLICIEKMREPDYEKQ